jgi:catechol 2,3-dioxygenase-like lactoylglutathione lyase family enzyme
MSNETVIPLLPCRSIEEMLTFYTQLGFTVTYRQKAPNVYAAVRWSRVELHFYVLKGHDSARNHCSCIVLVDDPEPLHRLFSAALRAARGKVPATGIPRIARWRKGQTRFNVVDPAGNWVRFISRNENVDRSAGASGTAPMRRDSRLGEAVITSRILRDDKGDDRAAARVLDIALARSEPVPVQVKARAIVARAELALALNEDHAFAAMCDAFNGLALTEADRNALEEELEEMSSMAQKRARAGT